MPEVTTLRSFIADHSYDDAENLLALLDTALREAATEARRELDVDVLAKAVLRAAKEDGRRPVTDGFEWYGSALEMATGIAAEYRRILEARDA